ncbi:MAG: hypothetical protein ACRC62_04705 [Microcoleus sp.]
MLNLRSNPEAAIAALKQMGDYVPGQGEFTIAGAIEWLKSVNPEDEEAALDAPVVYGNGGFRRYPVSIDGTISYSVYHGKSLASKARDLGFDLD